jgi:hypothetical protein
MVLKPVLWTQLNSRVIETFTGKDCDDWFGISCMTTHDFCFYLQNRLIQTSQTVGQQYSDTSSFSIPWSDF